MAQNLSYRRKICQFKVCDKSDFLAAIMKGARLLIGNDEEQPGHIVYLTDGRLTTKNFSERIEFLDACMPGSLHIITLSPNKSENYLVEQMIQRVKENGKRASTDSVDHNSYHNFAETLFNNEFAPLTSKLRIGKLECRLSGMRSINEYIRFLV